LSSSPCDAVLLLARAPFEADVMCDASLRTEFPNSAG